MTDIKVILAGDACVGKTCFAMRLSTGEYNENYLPTIGVEARSLCVKTNKVDVNFHIWDTAGDEKFMGLRDGYYIQGKCAIVMFSLTSKKSLKTAGIFINRIRRICEEIPIVLCGNKSDETTIEVTKNEIVMFLAKYPGIKYFQISAKCNSNLARPLFSLGHSLLGNDIVFGKHSAKNGLTTEERSHLPLDESDSEEVDNGYYGSNVVSWFKSWF